MSIGNRIKELRKALGMNQTEFGDSLFSKQSTVTGWERGIRYPSNNIINSICTLYNVNESWLRDGSGPMFLEKSIDEELAEFFGSISGLDDGFKKRFIRILAELPPDWWEILEAAVIREAEKNKAPEDPAP